MVRSSWSSERSTVNSQTPTAVPNMPPASSISASARSTALPPPVGDRAGARRGGDVARDARDRDRRRDADEDQQRRHQEAAADAEHAGDEADREPHREDQEDIDGDVGDREIDLHAGGPAIVARSGEASRLSRPRQLGPVRYRLDRGLSTHLCNAWRSRFITGYARGVCRVVPDFRLGAAAAAARAGPSRPAAP